MKNVQDNTLENRITRIEERLIAIKDGIDDIKRRQENEFVTKLELEAVKNEYRPYIRLLQVIGTLIVTALVGAILSLILIK